LALERIARLDAGLRSMVHVDAQAALHEASDRAAALARGEAPGALHGVPVAIKDVFDVAGMPTRANSRLFNDAGPARHDSAVVARLRAAGAVVVGKAHCWELSVGGPSAEPPFPPARNPWDPAREPGGSSSGPGAAVGAALVPVAIGGDTGGSIRLPASACGIVGFKPSHGLVPMDGALPFASSLDVAGPLVRDARDAALVHGVIAATGVPGRLAPGGLRIGVPVALLERTPPGADMAARLEECLAVLRRAGHAVGPVALPAAEVFNACYFLVARAEAHARWREVLRAADGRPGSIARRSLSIGAFIDEADVERATRLRVALRAGFDALFAGFDILCLPTMPGEAGPLDPGDAVTRPDTAPYTRPFSLVGAPAISMPCGRGASGLPLGVQFVGARGDDARLLAFACALEEDPAWPWRAELPEAFAWK
jgi:aspartyl-tRNA(Asn)/glutamyl-tRNA(Gln) amidotransferase subunit A